MTEERVHRRLAAILAADVVGYSRLMEQDEAGTLEALKERREGFLQPLIAEHRGRVVKVMGDGVLVEFASAVNAVACAIELQKRMAAANDGVAEDRRVLLRIGVNLGDVVVDGNDLLGDAVNIAARLEQLCEPGGVLISGTAFDHLQGKLELHLDYAGEQQVKNISRPVRVYRARPDSGGPPWRLRARQHRRMLVAAAVLMTLVLAGSGIWLMRPIESASGKSSIAVLPFNNLGGDEPTGRLADGITEDIITDLARFRDLDVIASHSVEPYKGKSVDVRQIGRDLKVGYVLEGSIQRQADRFRVTAQLTETAGGAHLWSERWDRPAADIFAVQTEVSDRVAGTLGGSGVLLNQSRAAAKRKRPSDLQAYDLYALASEQFSTGLQAADEKGLEYVNAAIDRDPGFARAYVLKAWLTWELVKFHKGNFDEVFAEMERLGRTAVAIDPYDADAHALLAWAVGSPDRIPEALAETDQALQLNPSSGDVLVKLADSMPVYGRPEQGAEMCDRAFRLNPTPPAWYNYFCVVPLYFARRYQESIDDMNRGAAAGSPPNEYMLTIKATSQAELGQAQAAAETVAELKRRYPEVSFERFLNTGWIFARQQEEQQILASVRKAGIRLCATEEELKGIAKPRRLPECTGKPAG